MDQDLRTVIAFRRFGFGVRPGERRRSSGEGEEALRAELADLSSRWTTQPRLLTTKQAYMRSLAFGRAVLRGRTKRKIPAALPRGGVGAPRPDARSPMSPLTIFRLEAEARVTAAVTAEVGYVERLVAFWSNHFAVSAKKGYGLQLAGAFEREAIRANVLGRFEDMLAAVVKHPAMLFYLDNQLSVGPNSWFGKRRKRGLNENLAREILELHTVGLDAHFTQADVIALSNILTGWTFHATDKTDPDNAGEFVFNDAFHETGQQRVLGRSYAENGVDQGEAVLRDLGRHPATFAHLAEKFAAHFVSDDPPRSLVMRLQQVLQETEGDLYALALALIEAPEAWAPASHKVLAPWDWCMSIARISGIPLSANIVTKILADLGAPLWSPPSPKGFPDRGDVWLGPDSLTVRLNFASWLGTTIPEFDPAARAEEVLGAALSEATRRAVAGAETRSQAFALLVMSPEFLRR